MWQCRKVRGLIAASVYDDLNDQERTLLDGHLASCAACRAEAEALENLAARIPDPNPRLDVDLVPILRRRLAETGMGPPRRVWRYALTAAASIVVIAAISYGVSGYLTIQDRAQPLVATSGASSTSPMGGALNEAARLAAGRDYPGAYRLLRQAVNATPDDPLAADAQERCAAIAFAELRWYPEAYTAYSSLAQRYPAAYPARPESIERLELLAEARANDYAALYALDAARRGMGDQFAEYERVIARYPATFVAHLAASDMAGLVARDAPAAEAGHGGLAAMEYARERCTDPVAVAQLKVEVGHIYWKEMNNPEKARDLYNEVAASGNTVLARLAKDSLANLNLNASQ